MTRTAALLLVIVALPATVLAQERPAPTDHRLREPYITRSGATVDKPGEPQGSAPTSLDREINRQNNAIDRSICKGC